MVDWGVVCLLAANCGSMGAATCAAVLQSLPISHHFHGCTAHGTALRRSEVALYEILGFTFFTFIYSIFLDPSSGALKLWFDAYLKQSVDLNGIVFTTFLHQL